MSGLVNHESVQEASSTAPPMSDFTGDLFALSERRPVIGFGGINIYVFVDFDDWRSLNMLADFIDLVRHNFALKITIVYYAPSRKIHDQAMAIFSIVVNKVLKPKKHLIYLETLIKNHSKHKSDAIIRSIRAAGIPVRDMMSLVPLHSQEAASIIEENNRIGYTLSKSLKTPVVIIGDKIIYSYLDKKQMKAVVNYVIKKQSLARGDMLNSRVKLG